MVNPILLLVSALFFLAMITTLYTLGWISITVFLRLVPRLPTWRVKPLMFACLFLPPIAAGAFTAGGAFLRHHHAPDTLHPSISSGSITWYPAATEGKLLGIVGLALQVAAWFLLAYGLFAVFRLWRETIALERDLALCFHPPSEKLVLTLTRVQADGDFSSLQFFEADIPMAYSCLIGIRRVRCVLSKELVASSTPHELEAVVMHEINHYLAGDGWRMLLVGTLNCLFFYLLPVRLLAQRWREETELTCDAATAIVTQKPLALASAILRTHGVLVQSPRLPNSTLGFSEETACSPQKRLERLVAYAQGASLSTEPAQSSVWQWAVIAAPAALGIVFLLSPQITYIAHCSLEIISDALH